MHSALSHGSKTKVPHGMASNKSVPEKDWRSRKRAMPQACHAGNVSALPKQLKVCELAGVTRDQHAQPLSACIRTWANGENIGYYGQYYDSCVHEKDPALPPARTRDSLAAAQVTAALKTYPSHIAHASC
jgi:hypothetical protein